MKADDAGVHPTPPYLPVPGEDTLSGSPPDTGESEGVRQTRTAMKLIGSGRLIERRRAMRKVPTPAEKVLWGLLRNKQLGVKFRRQHGIASYIVDFFTVTSKLIIELDGDVHERDDVQRYDHERQRYLISLGYKILRFRNDEVLLNPDHVLETIRAALHSWRG